MLNWLTPVFLLVSIVRTALPCSFEISPSSSTPVVGEKLTLSCLVSNANDCGQYPVVWKKGNEVVSRGCAVAFGSNIIDSINCQSNTYTIVINNIEGTDSGQYTCATTGTGPSINIDVKYKAKQVKITSDRDTIVEGSTHKFQCIATGGNPDSYTYTWQWRSDVNAQWQTLQEKSSNLNLDKVTYTDAGDYKCSASNTAGTTDSTTSKTLTVQHVPIFEGQHKGGAEIGNVLNVELSFLAVPLVNSVSCRNERNELQTVAKDSGNKWRINYSQLQRRDLGILTCTASNTIGASLPFTIEITAAGPPDKPILHQPTSSLDSINVTWESQFDGGSPQKFNIEYRESGDSEWKVVQINEKDPGPGTNMTYEITELEIATKYLVRVVADNDKGTVRSDTQEISTLAEVKTGGIQVLGIIIPIVLIVVILIVVGIVVYIVRERRAKALEEEVKKQAGTEMNGNEITGITNPELVVEDNKKPDKTRYSDTKEPIYINDVGQEPVYANDGYKEPVYSNTGYQPHVDDGTVYADLGGPSRDKHMTLDKPKLIIGDPDDSEYARVDWNRQRPDSGAHRRGSPEKETSLHTVV